MTSASDWAEEEAAKNIMKWADMGIPMSGGLPVAMVAADKLEAETP